MKLVQIPQSTIQSFLQITFLPGKRWPIKAQIHQTTILNAVIEGSHRGPIMRSSPIFFTNRTVRIKITRADPRSRRNARNTPELVSQNRPTSQLRTSINNSEIEAFTRRRVHNRSMNKEVTSSLNIHSTFIIFPE